MKVEKIFTARWADEAHTMIDVTVKFEEMAEAIPFTAVNYDQEDHVRDVWNIAAAMPPEPFVAVNVPDAIRLEGKIAEINQWRDRERESGFVEYKGKRYDRDSLARDNILGVLTAGVMPVPFWTTYDNEDEPSTLEDLQQIYGLIIEAGGQIHARQRQMKSEVAALTCAAISNYVVGWEK